MVKVQERERERVRERERERAKVVVAWALSNATKNTNFGDTYFKIKKGIQEVPPPNSLV
jgi:hypothetical protein